MKALIAAGGSGTRLRPLTYTTNKHLLPVANRPLIYYAVDSVLQAGIKEVGVVISPETGEQVQRALGDGSRWGACFTYILQEAPLGLAHVVLISRPFLGNEPFMFYLGDNIFAERISPIAEEFQRTIPSCLLVLARVSSPGQFGVAEIENGRVARVEERPRVPKSPFAVTGLYFYDKRIFEAAESISPSNRGELEISDAHQYLINKGFEVGHREITGWWKDAGNAEGLIEVNRIVLQKAVQSGNAAVRGQVDSRSLLTGKVIIENGARVINSQVNGPAIIGTGSAVENSFVGPFTSIGAGCQVRNSMVENSILLEGAQVLDFQAKIERSLVAQEAMITAGPLQPGS